jgi:hypothetical protein
VSVRLLLNPGSERVSSQRRCSSSDLSVAIGPSSVTSGQRPSRPAGVGLLLRPAPARRQLKRPLLGRGSAAPALSATRVPAYTWHMPSALPCHAGSALGSNGWRTLPSRVLLLPRRREEAQRLTLHPRCLCVRTANAYRTGHAFVTLPPLVSPPARKREGAGASPGSSSCLHSSSRNAKTAPVFATVRRYEGIDASHKDELTKKVGESLAPRLSQADDPVAWICPGLVRPPVVRPG